MLRVQELCKEKGITKQELVKEMGVTYQALYSSISENPTLWEIGGNCKHFGDGLREVIND